MPLILECQNKTSIPVEVDGILPERLTGCSDKTVASQQIWFGNRQVELAEIFGISGCLAEDHTIVWTGPLQAVHWIGASMSWGTMVIEGSTGRHVASRMSGGTIFANSDVSDFAGCEMSGGLVKIEGSSGDHLGARYPGSKFGMNRGTILVGGCAGSGVGQGMRRGTIAVGGNAGALCGWQMLAGSIIVMGSVGRDCGAEMIRGTIVVNQPHELDLLPSFATGGIYHDNTIRMLGEWLTRISFAPAQELLHNDHYQTFHGDRLWGGRGEVFFPIEGE